VAQLTTVEARYIANTLQYVNRMQAAIDANAKFAQSAPQAGKAIEGLEGSAQKATRGMGLLKIAMGSAIGIAAVGMIRKTTRVLKSFGMESFHAAARVDELDIAMGAIGESTGIGYEAIKEAADGIRSQGIEMASAQQIAIQFAQANLDMAAASKIARVAQDLAVVAGLNSTETTNRLIKAIITGNSELLRTAGISKTAKQAQMAYSEETGKAVGKLTALEKQQAMVNMIMAEGERVQGTYEASMNSAGKVLRSFPRIINDIQVEVGKILSSAFGPLIKTTYDLIKAFSIAVRDGGSMSASLGSIRDVALEVTQPLIDGVEALTAWVKQGDGLKAAGEGLAAMAAKAATVVPVLVELAMAVGKITAVTSSMMLPALMALASTLNSVATALQPLLTMIGALPGPVKTAIGALLLLVALGRKSATVAKAMAVSWGQLGAVATGAATRTVGAFGMMGAAQAAWVTRLKADMIAAKTQMGALGAGAKFMAAGVVGSFRAIGAAARGLMAAIGPVGWAMLAAGAAFEIFSGKSAAAQQFIDNLKATLDEVTGAFTAASEAALAASLRDMLSPEDQMTLAGIGASATQMAAALLEGGDAAAAMHAKLSDFAANSGHALSPATQSALTMLRNYEGAAKSVDALRAEQAALAREEQMLSVIRVSSSANAKRAAESADMLAAAQHLVAVNTRSASTAAADYAQKGAILTAATESAEAAITGLNSAFTAIEEGLAREATFDATRAAFDNLTASLKENGRTLNANTEKGRENRANVRDLAQSYVDWAKATDDPIKQQKRLEQGDKALKKALGEKAAGKSGVTKLFEEQKEKSGELVAKWEADKAKALTAGISVGEEFINGIIAGLKKREADLEAAAAATGALLPEGAAGPDGIDAESPSKKGRRLGGWFVDGLVIGMRAKGQKAEREAASAGARFVKAMASALSNAEATFGSLPSGKPLIETLLGEKALEAFQKSNEKVLTQLGEMLDLIQRIGDAAKELGGSSTSAMESSMGSGLFSQLKDIPGMDQVREMLSPIQQAFGVGGDFSTAIAQFDQMQAAIDDYYSALMELPGVSKKAAKAIARDQERALADLNKYARRALELMAERARLIEEMRKAEQAYEDKVREINSSYDLLDKAASDAIAALEAKWDAAIPGLERALERATAAFDKENAILQGLVDKRNSFLDGIASGFRSFLNNLKPDGYGDTFAGDLKARLKAMQDFAANVKTLAARGLDAALLRDLVSAGPEQGGGLAAHLVGGGDISAINATQQALASTVADFTAFANEQWFQSGIDQQAAIVAPLQASVLAAQSALDAANAARASELTAARAHQEQLRVDREAALAAAAAEHKTAMDALVELLRLNGVAITDNANTMNATFTAMSVKLVADMKKIGRQAVNGIIAGINAKEKALLDRMTALGQAMREALNNALDIHSPSGVTEWTGEMVVAGLVNALRDGQGDVAAAAGLLGQAAGAIGSGAPSAAAMAASGGGGVTVINNTLQVDVRAGVGDPRQIGQEVIEYITRYEGVNGPVFARPTP